MKLLYAIYVPGEKTGKPYVVKTYLKKNGFETRVIYAGEKGFVLARSLALKDIRKGKRG